MLSNSKPVLMNDACKLDCFKCDGSNKNEEHYYYVSACFVRVAQTRAL